MNRLSAIALIASVPLAEVAAFDTVLSQGPEWTYRQLDLEVTIDTQGPALEVRGQGVLELRGAPGSEIRLFLNTREPAMRFDELRTPGTDANVVISTEEPRHLAVVELSEPRNPGDSVVIAFTVRWSEPSMVLLVSDSVALGSWVEAWYPVPESNGTQHWAAPGSTRFQLPARWSAVSNGTPEMHAPNDRSAGPRAWYTAEPMNRSFVAGPYHPARTTTGDREFGVYVLEADSVSASHQAAVLEQAISAMEEAWGQFPYDSYAIVEIPDGAVIWAAASEQGFIMASSSQFGEFGNLPLFAHEAAHAWWGNRVQTTGPGALMVGESLAQYGAVVAIEAIEGIDAMNEFLRFSRDNYSPFQSANGYFEIVRRGCDMPLAQLPYKYWDPWYHHLSDAKGHWFYHMLRHRVGDERFFAVLRDLLREFDGRSLSLAELRQRFVESVPDDPGLPAFLSQWLDRTGAPVLEARWWTTENGRGVEVEITQSQSELYRMDLTVELELINGHRLQEEIHLYQRSQNFVLSAHARIVGLALDPDHRLLLWRPEYGRVPAQLDRSSPLEDVVCEPLSF